MIFLFQFIISGKIAEIGKNDTTHKIMVEFCTSLRYLVKYTTKRHHAIL